MNGKVSTVIRRFALGNKVMIGRIKKEYLNTPKTRRGALIQEMRDVITIRKQKVKEAINEPAQQPSI